MGVGEGSDVLVDVGEGVIVRVGEGEGITVAVGVTVAGETVTSPGRSFMHAATTTITRHRMRAHLIPFEWIAIFHLLFPFYEVIAGPRDKPPPQGADEPQAQTRRSGASAAEPYVCARGRLHCAVRRRRRARPTAIGPLGQWSAEPEPLRNIVRSVKRAASAASVSPNDQGHLPLWNSGQVHPLVIRLLTFHMLAFLDLPDSLE